MHFSPPLAGVFDALQGFVHSDWMMGALEVVAPSCAWPEGRSRVMVSGWPALWQCFLHTRFLRTAARQLAFEFQPSSPEPSVPSSLDGGLLAQSRPPGRLSLLRSGVGSEP